VLTLIFSGLTTFFLATTLYPETQRRLKKKIDAVVGIITDRLPYVNVLLKEVGSPALGASDASWYVVPILHINCSARSLVKVFTQRVPIDRPGTWDNEQHRYFVTEGTVVIVIV
jgi:hypothetical protein